MTSLATALAGLRSISKPVWGICLLLTADYFLLNRFDVPYSIIVGHWRIDPLSLATAVLFGGLWLLGSERRAELVTRAERFTFWGLTTWLAIALVGTFLNPMNCTPNFGGFACLIAICLWMMPVLILPNLRLTRRDTLVILYTYLGLTGIGICVNICFLLGPKLISTLMGWEAPPLTGRAFLPLGVATVLGCVFVMGIPLVVGLYFHSGCSRWSRNVFVFICLLLIIGVITTGSRASILMTVLALAVSTFVIGSGKIQTRSIKIGVAACLLAIVLGGLVLGERARLVSFYDGSIAWRMRGASSAITMVADRPLLGSGIERFFHRLVTGRYSTLFGDDGMQTIIYRNLLTQREPHNLYLITAAETGLAGLICFLVYLGGNLWNLISTALAIKNETSKALLKGMAISVTIVLLNSITESMLLARPRFAILIGILWGTYRRYARLCTEESEVFSQE